MTAAFAAMLAMSPMAFAQTTSTTTNSPTSATSTHALTANHITSGQIRATQMDGARVYDRQNQNIGDIKDIILDKDGKVAAVVLNVGAFLGVGGKFVAVPMNDVKVDFDKDNKPHFTVDMTKDQLKAAQAFDLDEKKASTGSSTTTGTSTPPRTEPRTNPPPAERK